jgi:hypothetical protein
MRTTLWRHTTAWWALPGYIHGHGRSYRRIMDDRTNGAGYALKNTWENHSGLPRAWWPL